MTIRKVWHLTITDTTAWISSWEGKKQHLLAFYSQEIPCYISNESLCYTFIASTLFHGVWKITNMLFMCEIQIRLHIKRNITFSILYIE